MLCTAVINHQQLRGIDMGQTRAVFRGNYRINRISVELEHQFDDERPWVKKSLDISPSELNLNCAEELNDVIREKLSDLLDKEEGL